MTEETEKPQIGGGYCRAEIEPGLIQSAGQVLTTYEEEALWRIFQAIGHQWRNLYVKAKDSRNLKSSWLDFIRAKTEFDPSYVGEYSNAVLCVDELIEIHESEDVAFYLLFFSNNIAPGPPLTRLAHTKKFVVDEFIRVNVVASGFKSFGAQEGTRARNYKGYLGGSRYNLKARVVEFEDPEKEVPETEVPEEAEKVKAAKATPPKKSKSRARKSRARKSPKTK